jgi:hypothetical protein
MLEILDIFLELKRYVLEAVIPFINAGKKPKVSYNFSPGSNRQVTVSEFIWIIFGTLKLGT